MSGVRVELQSGLRRGGRRRLRQGRVGARRLGAGRRGVHVRWELLVGLAVLAALAYVAFALLRPLPGLRVLAVPHAGAFTGAAPRLAWPAQGEAAIGLQEGGMIGTHGSGQPTPIASVAKVMTAYVVLADHPLHGGADGPQITVSPADVAAYRSDNAAGQSVVAVRAGEHLTERQALEGLLLPSGNNIATQLARWDAGSEAAFLAKMNASARALGLTHTRYTSPSGVRPSTASTAGDQVRLGMRALEVPALAQIAAMKQATLPVAGLQFNKDPLLGTDGVVGIKTGTTSQAGGCFLFAAREQLAGHSLTLVGAVLHQGGGTSQPTITDPVFGATRTLLASTKGALVPRRMVRRGATLAWMKAPWASPVALQAARGVSLIGWPGLRTRTRMALPRELSAPISAGQDAGSAVIAADEQLRTVPLVPSRTVPDASLAWRLTHP